MLHTRASGILCHPTSLPSPYGIGDLGDGADQFIEFLAAAGQSVWQVLPLGPTGYGDSPYQPFSAFACNPLLISPQRLAEDGLLAPADLPAFSGLPDERVDYGWAIDSKRRLLQRSFERFMSDPQRWDELDQFQAANGAWLDDYALFMALKQHLNWAVWTEWPTDIALRQPQALDYWREALANDITYHCYVQLQAARQWERVHILARQAGVQLIGDMPIFVGHDSADVWAHRAYFLLNDRGQPTVVAGVPPDYFSPTGQRWGNPLYNWQQLQTEGYAWWIERLRRVLTLVDQVRLDHFRGFAGYWEVPAHEPTAVNGRWVRGPGMLFFDAVRQALGELPIIAEDLGLISADVIALRKALDLPGMRVLQFAFDSDSANEHLPHHWEREVVVYTGTHDNDTTVGWYMQLAPETRLRVNQYTGVGEQVNWDMMRLALVSVANLVIFPLQDILGCGSDCRLNAPGQPSGNWTWRFRAEDLHPELANRLRELTMLSGRYQGPGRPAQENLAVVLDYQEP